MLVSAKPRFDFSLIRQAAFSDVEIEKSQSFGFLFFPTGRQAIVAAVKAVGAKAEDTVLVPAFICASVPATLSSAGFNVRFYDCDTSICTVLKNVLLVPKHQRKFVITVDYFGCLSNQLAELAFELKQQGCLVIEDRCHSLPHFSNDGFRYESMADAQVYSLRKQIAVADGGLLVLPNQGCSYDYIGERQGSLGFLIRHVLEQFVVFIGWPNIFSKTSVSPAIKVKIGLNCEVSQGKKMKRVLPSRLLNLYLNSLNTLKNYGALRRNNYAEFESSLSKVGLNRLFPSIADRSSPYVFPLLDTSGQLAVKLRKRGIGAFNWPGLDCPSEIVLKPEKYPLATKLIHRVVCLPVHQSLTSAEKRLILKCLSEEAGLL